MRLIQKLMPASKQKLVISSIGVLALILFSGFVLFEATKAEVVFADNGKEKTVTTHTNTVGSLLEELGITVGKHDALSHEMDTLIESGMTINYDTAKKVIVSIDGEEEIYHTTAETIEAFFEEAELSFSNHDSISHNTAEATEDGLHIEISKAYEVTINDGGEEKKVLATGGTVKDLLDEAEVRFDQNSNDIVKPALDAEVSKGNPITIVRVSEDEEVVTETLAFDTEKREDDTLLEGNEKVISEGEKGFVEKIYKITKHNGEEVERELVTEDVTESVNRVVAVGTKKEPEPKSEANLVTLSSKESNSPANSSGSSSAGGKTMTMTASAFTAECSGCSGYTATGINLKADPNRKVIAVDPTVIPLGTKVWVEGYGEAIAGDTGGHIKGNRIDIHVPNKSDAYSWGVKTVQVKIID
ncbi:G5 and 3D domain-containing protein [Oceanobacillus damuensis]|uniref:G5 and 3D domain-containing protein n=1 Tax=Oceanobacillus damuensis TaxID=937928 RepID=UPI00082A57F1|nr:G5 and 3D domain-containing protein [Oceanobacillus damuensis]